MFLCFRRSLALGLLLLAAGALLAALGLSQTARATEAAILFVPHVIRSTGFTPFAISIAR